MKLKKVLGYIGVGLIGVAAGAIIFSPEVRENVIGKIKAGKDWVGGKLKRKENTCGDEVDPESEEPAPEEESKDDRQQKGGKWGGYYKKPYNNKKNN